MKIYAFRQSEMSSKIGFTDDKAGGKLPGSGWKLWKELDLSQDHLIALDGEAARQAIAKDGYYIAAAKFVVNELPIHGNPT